MSSSTSAVRASPSCSRDRARIGSVAPASRKASTIPWSRFACAAAAGHRVIGLDEDAALVRELERGRAPLYEPDLDALIAAQTAAGRLCFTMDPAESQEARNQLVGEVAKAVIAALKR